MRVIRGSAGRCGGALALAALLLVPATTVDARGRRQVKPLRLAANAPGFGAFTPAAADPRVAASFARSGLGTPNFGGGAFRFTPSTNRTSRRAVTVAVRARTVSRAEAARTLALASSAAAPSAYSLGASIGWKRFALSGDVTRLDGGMMPIGRESADIGFSFAGKRWATKLDLAADRASGQRANNFGLDESVSLGLGGSYALTHNLDLTGGVRYKRQRDELMALSTLDDKRDSQAVYLGTTFRF